MALREEAAKLRASVRRQTERCAANVLTQPRSRGIVVLANQQLLGLPSSPCTSQPEGYELMRTTATARAHSHRGRSRCSRQLAGRSSPGSGSIHLQRHFGADTLSMAQRDAVGGRGLDFVADRESRRRAQPRRPSSRLERRARVRRSNALRRTRGGGRGRKLRSRLRHLRGTICWLPAHRAPGRRSSRMIPASMKAFILSREAHLVALVSAMTGVRVRPDRGNPANGLCPIFVDTELLEIDASHGYATRAMPQLCVPTRSFSRRYASASVVIFSIEAARWPYRDLIPMARRSDAGRCSAA